MSREGILRLPVDLIPEEPTDPVPAATRAQYAALKECEPDLILLFEGERATYYALGADIDAVRRLVRGTVAYLLEPADHPTLILIRREDLNTVLSLIVQAGRRAAVLEALKGA